MKRFSFRLQKVLEYREMQEEWAKSDYLEKRAARLGAEQEIVVLDRRRKTRLADPVPTLEDRRVLEQYLARIDDEEAIQRRIIEELEEEEAAALDVWRERKQALEAMVRLRDQALEEWTLNETRQEQAELDEWAVLRRKEA